MGSPLESPRAVVFDARVRLPTSGVGNRTQAKDGRLADEFCDDVAEVSIKRLEVARGPDELFVQEGAATGSSIASGVEDVLGNDVASAAVADLSGRVPDPPFSSTILAGSSMKLVFHVAVTSAVSREPVSPQANSTNPGTRGGRGTQRSSPRKAPRHGFARGRRVVVDAHAKPYGLRHTSMSNEEWIPLSQVTPRYAASVLPVGS